MAATRESPRQNTDSTIRPSVGYIQTTLDAMRMVVAARNGVVPRTTRRMNDSERGSLVRSGAVFIFCVEESNIQRWTDGINWSASRVFRNFLVYRETTLARDPSQTTPTAISGGLSGRSFGDRAQHTQGSLEPLRPNGLFKKTITINLEEMEYHVISYYTEEDLRRGRLHRPTIRADIMGMTITPAIVRAANLRYPPPIMMGANGQEYVFDAEESSLANQAGALNGGAATAVPEPPTFSTHTWAVATPNAVDASSVTGFHTTSFFVSGSPATSPATSSGGGAALGYVNTTADYEPVSTSDGHPPAPFTETQAAQGDYTSSQGGSAHQYNGGGAN